MRRILLGLLCILIFSDAQAQTSVFHEDFELVDSMSSSGNPTWFQQSGYFTSPSNCMRDTTVAISPGVGDSSLLTSISFSTLGNFFIRLNFNHICKINVADAGTVEVSNNNGTTWTQLTAAQRTSSSGGFATNVFNSATYGQTAAGWFPQIGNDTITPNQSWWRAESFDISTLVQNAANVKIRFKLKDRNGNGNQGNYGWLIDDINVVASFSELIPPRIVWAPPIVQNDQYFLGPFVISDTMTDVSGIDTAFLFYTVNGGSQITAGMSNTTGNIWQGTIPALNDGDTVCYYVQAFDSSPNANSALLPSSGCVTFYVHSGIVFPYIDQFNSLSSPWTDSSGAGTSWQLGVPNFGVTNSAHSAPYAWDVNLNTAYTNNTRCVLTSPVLNFTGVYNSKLSLWRNHNTEANWDGVHIEYSINNGTSWKILGYVGDPLGTNWYNRGNALGPLDTIWDGNSNGWKLSTYRLFPLNNAGAQVKFRFVFMSDGSGIVDGFTIDDFAIELAPAIDAGVSSIVLPGNSAGAGTSGTVKVALTNFGSQPVSGFNVYYSINGGTPVAQAYTGTLTPALNDTLTFTTPFTVPIGSYRICAYTVVAGDTVPSNDTICKNTQGVPLYGLPYANNFDTGATNTWYDSSSAGTRWQLGTPNFGLTNSAFSAPNSWDINLNSAYGTGARALLTSPLFDFTGQLNAKLSFWMNRNIATGAGAFLEYTINGGNSWQRLGIVNDPNAINNNWYSNANISATNLPGWDGNSGGWIKYTYILGPPFNNAGANVQFRFIFISGAFATTSDGISIDDFSIIPSSPIDIGVTVVNQPGNSTAAGTNATVDVTFKNFGSATITASDIAYKVNGLLIATEPWSGSLAPSATTNFTFVSQFTVPLGLYNFCAYTSLVTDSDHSNDTSCTARQGVPLITLPYFDNFDAGPTVWVDSSSEPNTHWQLGLPNYLQTTGTYSPPNSWDINLNAAYATNARSYLISPLFDFTNIFNAKLSFFQNYNVENSWDGIRIDYSTNAGATWNVLGVQFDPLGTRWYNDNIITSSTFPGWTGVSIDSTTGIPGWFQSTYKLVPLNNAGNQVMFRFAFTSDGSANVAGASIDNFKIVPPSPIDASALVIVQPASLAPAGVSSVVRVVISNEGSSAISNFPVSYTINGVLSGTTTYTGTLLPAQRDTVTLPSFIFPTGNFIVCAFTDLPGDGDQLNDTTCKNSFGLFTIGVPFADNFEGAINFFSTSPSEWQFGVPNSSIINAAFSPTHAWKTKLIGNYSGNNNDNLYTPFFDFTGAYKPELKFWHWFETQPGAFGDGGRVEISTNGGVIWETLGSYQDTAATNWYTLPNLSISTQPAWAGSSSGYIESVYRLHQLDNWQGGLVQFRFNFTSNGFTNNNGWAIDNFEIYSPFPNVAPIEMSPIINPFNATANATQADSVKIFNRGSLHIDSLDVSLIIDGDSVATDHITYSPALAPGTYKWHTFSTLWTPSPGGHHICAATSNPNGGADINPADDNLCIYGGIFDSSRVTLSSFYCNDFEGGKPQLIPMNAYNYSLYTSDWELGTPDKSFINTAYSGSNAWITKLTGVYNARDSSGLFSPVFAVDTAGCYELSFWHNFKTETFQDGGTVDYSNNGGVTWNRLGFAYEFNWYNSLYITGLPGPPTAGWSGNSNGWIYSAHFVRFGNTGHVLFRFRFGSDLTNEQDGWAIDDMCFRKVAYCVIGIDELAGNAISLGQAYPNPASDAAIVSYSIPAHGKVKLYLTDILGRSVNVLVNETLDAGIHRTELNVRNLADGLYYYTLEFDNQKMVRKLVVTH